MIPYLVGDENVTTVDDLLHDMSVELGGTSIMKILVINQEITMMIDVMSYDATPARHRR